MPASPILAIGSCLTARITASNGPLGSSFTMSRPYSCLASTAVGHRIVYHYLLDEIAQRAHEIDHLGIARVWHVLLEGEAHYQHARAVDALLPLEHGLDHVVGNEGRHAVIDAAPGEDHLRMEADRFGLVGQIIGIDANAVTADEAGAKRLEIPFGAGRLEHLARLEAKLLEQHGELVDQCDVHVALDVLDYLGGLGNADRARAMGAGGDDGAVHGVDQIGRLRGSSLR